MPAEFVLDTPVVRAFVAGVEATIAGAPSPDAACEGIRRGMQDEEIYAERKDRLELVEKRALRPGDFYALIPPRDDIRRVRTTSGEDGPDPPADERHRVRLAPRVRPRLG